MSGLFKFQAHLEVAFYGSQQVPPSSPRIPSFTKLRHWLTKNSGQTSEAPSNSEDNCALRQSVLESLAVPSRLALGSLGRSAAVPDPQRTALLRSAREGARGELDGFAPGRGFWRKCSLRGLKTEDPHFGEKSLRETMNHLDKPGSHLQVESASKSAKIWAQRKLEGLQQSPLGEASTPIYRAEERKKLIMVPYPRLQAEPRIREAIRDDQSGSASTLI